MDEYPFVLEGLVDQPQRSLQTGARQAVQRGFLKYAIHLFELPFFGQVQNLPPYAPLEVPLFILPVVYHIPAEIGPDQFFESRFMEHS